MLVVFVVMVLSYIADVVKTQVAYFTATFPYVMLTVLVVRGATLPGAVQGITYFFYPNWQQLARPEVSTLALFAFFLRKYFDVFSFILYSFSCILYLFYIYFIFLSCNFVFSAFLLFPLPHQK